MIRSEVIKQLIPVISNHFVVCNIGLPSQELHMLDDQPTNFYMLGTMGLSSSIGLGLALAQKQKVIAIDGDGSVLTNLGTLPTIANNVADNFVLLIIDNGSYGSTGDQPTYAGQKTSLTAVAIAGGFTYRAKKGHVYVIRGNDPDREEIKLDIDDKVKPGDIIRVAERLF